MQPLISVVVPSIRPATLEFTVRSMLAQQSQRWELLVIGQGDDDGMEQVVSRLAGTDPRVRYYHLPEKGISRAMNEGVRRATGEVIAYTDDDCEASADWIGTLADIFESGPSIDLVGGAVLAPPRTRRGFGRCPAIEPVEGLYDAARTPGKPPPGWGWIGANVAMRRTTAVRSPHDECLGPGTPLAAGEDTDLKLRLESSGARMLSTSRSLVHHTYGYRYGWKAQLAHARSYTIGNAAVAAKLTLSGDERGRLWTANTLRQCVRDPITRLRPYRLPYGLLRYRLYQRTYRACLSQYEVGDDGLLRHAARAKELAASPGATA